MMNSERLLLNRSVASSDAVSTGTLTLLRAANKLVAFASKEIADADQAAEFGDLPVANDHYDRAMLALADASRKFVLATTRQLSPRLRRFVDGKIGDCKIRIDACSRSRFSHSRFETEELPDRRAASLVELISRLSLSGEEGAMISFS